MWLRSLAVVAICVLYAMTQTETAGRAEFVIGKTCVLSVAMGEHFECAGPDQKHMVCRGLVLHLQPSCGSWRKIHDADR